MCRLGNGIIRLVIQVVIKIDGLIYWFVSCFRILLIPRMTYEIFFFYWMECGDVWPGKKKMKQKIILPVMIIKWFYRALKSTSCVIFIFIF